MSTQGQNKGGGFLSGTTADRPGRAALLMVSSLFILAFQDGIVKLTSSDVSLWQFQALRSAINVALLFILARLVWGTAIPWPRRPWAVALRSVFLVTAMVFFFGGVPFLSLTEIAAGLYVFPLFVAVLSALLLGERVGPRRIVAILTGFCGSLLILKPGTEAFQPMALMPVAAALFYAATILTTRRLCRAESPVTLTLGVAIALMITGILGITVLAPWAAGGLAPDSLAPDSLAQNWPYLFTGWHGIGLDVLALIFLCSIINVTANIGLAKAYQSAEASWLVPIDYSYLIFATFWGMVFWRHIPDGLTFLGMAMVAGAGIFVAWRERLESRQRALSVHPPE